MNKVLTEKQQEELLNRGFSRRNFGRIAAMLGAGAASLPFYNEAALAQLSQVQANPDEGVWINANENPLGPCKEAKEALPMSRLLISRPARQTSGISCAG